MKFNLDNFNAPDLEAWRFKIKAETKAIGNLSYKNEVEGIEFDHTQKTLDYDFGTQQDSEPNDWGITAYIPVLDEKTANLFALKCLSQGANVLYLNISAKPTDWNTVFKGIHIEYIHIIIAFEQESELQTFIDFIPKSAKEHISISIDPLRTYDIKPVLEAGFKLMVNGFHLEQIGANSIDQLSTILYFAESLIGKTEPNNISFEIGIGSNFFLELAKVRALKWLWRHILLKNNKAIPKTSILGRMGWTNKSLKDPDTNILRQTTESISSISGGVSAILIHSSHTYSLEPNNWFYKRLALNISHILKEESYLTKVNDPMRGAYLSEKMTFVLIQNCWSQFRKFIEIEDKEVIINQLKESIEKTRALKSEAFEKAEHELIGINLFKNAKEQKNKWSNVPNYLGFDYLIFEKGQDA